jgi:hypothetical protein
MIYLIGIPGVNMYLIARKPFEIDYDEICIQGKYIKVTKNTGYFYYEKKDKYIYLVNGRTKGDKDNWKDDMSQFV